MKALVVCYKTKSDEEYLAYYSYKTKKEVQQEVAVLNETQPDKLFNGIKIDWEKIEYFFQDEQEEMY